MSTLCRSCFPLLACVSLLATAVPGQTSAPPCFVIPDQGRVLIILASPPKTMAGFLVYRKTQEEQEFSLLTQEPVLPVDDPAVAREMLGEEEYGLICRAVGVGPDEEFILLRRLRDPGIGGALSLVSPGVAAILGKVFVDTTAGTGAEYAYRVVFTGHEGEEISRIDETVRVRKHEVPDLRVGRPTLTVGKGQLRLEWEYPKWQPGRADIVVGFNVYRKTGDEQEFAKMTPFPYLRTGEELFFVDENVEQGQTYGYYLRPVDLVGAEGPASETVAAELQDITAPRPPREVSAQPAEGLVVISWEPSIDEDVVGYNVYRSWSIHGQFAKLNPHPLAREATSFVDEHVETGQLYVYRLSAIDRAGLEGKHSAAVFASPEDTTPPPSVSRLSAAVADRMVRLSWAPAMTPDLDGYYVYRGEQPDNLFRLVGPPVARGTPAFTDSGFAGKGLHPGRTYHYAVSQVDIALNEGEKSLLEVMIPDDEPPMSVASVYCRNNDDGTVQVSWQASLSSDVAGYRVLRREGEQGPLLLGEVDASITRYLDRTCERGRQYTYSVSARDSAGNESEAMGFALAPRDIFAPPVPAGLVAVEADGRVNLAWDKVSADDLVGYNVYRSELPGGAYEKLNAEVVGAEAFVDPDGRTDAYYRVSSLDSSGNESPRSAPQRPEPRD